MVVFGRERPLEAAATKVDDSHLTGLIVSTDPFPQTTVKIPLLQDAIFRFKPSPYPLQDEETDSLKGKYALPHDQLSNIRTSEHDMKEAERQEKIVREP